VQRSRQRRKTRQDARGKGRACRGRNARREGRRVKLLVRVQDQRAPNEIGGGTGFLPCGGKSQMDLSIACLGRTERHGHLCCDGRRLIPQNCRKTSMRWMTVSGSGRERDERTLACCTPPFRPAAIQPKPDGSRNVPQQRRGFLERGALRQIGSVAAPGAEPTVL